MNLSPRTALAYALRSRVAGEDAAARAARIWGARGPRWFGPDDVIWRVHADASMFVGGIQALLLQSLHPLAMAGWPDTRVTAGTHGGACSARATTWR